MAATEKSKDTVSKNSMETTNKITKEIKLKNSKETKVDKKGSLDLSNDNGVTKGGLEIGNLTKTDYHNAMNAENYEKYFENICKRLKPRA